MNKRLKELALEARIAYYSKNGSYEGSDDGLSVIPSTQGLEKFAELIVRECISTLHDMHLWQSVNNQNYPNSWHDAVDQGIDAIKTHFGVEE